MCVLIRNRGCGGVIEVGGEKEGERGGREVGEGRERGVVGRWERKEVREGRGGKGGRWERGGDIAHVIDMTYCSESSHLWHVHFHSFSSLDKLLQLC